MLHLIKIFPNSIVIQFLKGCCFVQLILHGKDKIHKGDSTNMQEKLNNNNHGSQNRSLTCKMVGNHNILPCFCVCIYCRLQNC